MLIGGGLIARSFWHYEDNREVLIFASGVSNSKQAGVEEFNRESRLIVELLEANPWKLFVYFGTCSIQDNDLNQTPYVVHKARMEELVRERAGEYLIFRLPQVIGKGGNKYSLTNFLYEHIKRGASFPLWENAVRYIVDVADVSTIVSHVIETEYFQNRIINIASRPYYVREIVNVIEQIVQRRAVFTAIQRGSNYRIDCTDIQALLDRLGIVFDQDYLYRTLSKYYRPA